MRATELRIDDHANLFDNTLDPGGRQSPLQEQHAIDRSGVLATCPATSSSGDATAVPI